MILATRQLRRLESVDRRVLGAIQFVDAVMGVPVTRPADIEAVGAQLMGVPGFPEVVIPQGGVRLRQNRSGMHVVMSAPLFEDYTAAFENPPPPEETEEGPLRLRLAVTDAGPEYLPQEFFFDIPRSLNAQTPESVFVPHVVQLFRAPSASTQDGWTVLRVSVALQGTNPPAPAPGVLVSVRTVPRAFGEQPRLLGEGMTDWRGRAFGEAVVALPAVRRFLPGNGGMVETTEQGISFEAMREGNFTGAGAALPNATRMRAGTGADLIRPPDRPPGSQLQVLSPTPPVMVRSGREYVVRLAIP
jgi:hypothetical protein